MVIEEEEYLRVGEWPGIPDLFLIHLHKKALLDLISIYKKTGGKRPFRKILEDLIREALINSE